MNSIQFPCCLLKVDELQAIIDQNEKEDDEEEEEEEEARQR